MKLNKKQRELIAIGASITVNCQPCLKFHVEKALRAGADQQEVAEAIEVGNMVRKGAAGKMDAFLMEMQAASVEPIGTVVMEGNGYQFLGP